MRMCGLVVEKGLLRTTVRLCCGHGARGCAYDQRCCSPSGCSVHVGHRAPQVRAHILGTATSGVVDNSGILDASVRAATPSALLHVRLDALPTLRFTPAALQPMTLFADSTNAVQSQRIVVQNTGDVAVRFNVTVTPRCAPLHQPRVGKRKTT